MTDNAGKKYNAAYIAVRPRLGRNYQKIRHSELDIGKCKCYIFINNAQKAMNHLIFVTFDDNKGRKRSISIPHKA